MHTLQQSPLVLKSAGSFFVGGEKVKQSAVELSSAFGAPIGDGGGHIVIHQMYVQYMIPMKLRGPPVVMLHGNTLSGKTYETTPDGRMGWGEYFVRAGHAAYIPDQVSRGRSGVDLAIYNDVREGIVPPSALPSAFRHSNELNWNIFRFGTSLGVPFPDQQFPVKYVDELAKQGVPDFNAALPSPNPTYNALSVLARDLQGAVLMGHSGSGSFPLEAALQSTAGITGIVLIEPGIILIDGVCSLTPYTVEQIATLASVPILVVFGDYLDNPTGLPPFTWTGAFDLWNAFVARVNAAGGNATMVHLPQLGIHGNSHMPMMDKNNLQVADIILTWMDRNLTRGHDKAAKKRAARKKGVRKKATRR